MTKRKKHHLPHPGKGPAKTARGTKTVNDNNFLMFDLSDFQGHSIVDDWGELCVDNFDRPPRGMQ